MFNWLIKSSEDPTKASLTVKGTLESVGFLAAFIGVSSVDATNIVTNSGELVFGLLTAVGAARAIFGIVRKILNTQAGR